MPDESILKGPNSRAVIRIELAEELPALDFSLIINVIDQLYSKHLWIRLTNEAPVGKGPPEKFVPEPDQLLFLERAEVGSPNYIELIGLAIDVWPTFALVAGILGAGKATGGIYKNWEEARNIRANTKKTNLDTERGKIDLHKVMQELKMQGKMTEEQIVESKKRQGFLISLLESLLTKYAHASKMKMIESDTDSHTRTKTDTKKD